MRIGLTGGIGGGKSVVAAMFKKLGAAVLSADEIGRRLTETNPRIKEQIRREFGGDVFNENGSVDRKHLAEIVFSDRKKKEKLNAIVHPFVLREIEKEFTRLESNKDIPFIVHEAALIYEARVNKDLDYVVVVDANEETRIRRVMERDGISKADVLRRINSQLPAERKRQLADFVIENDGDLQSLQKRVRFLYDLLLRIGRSTERDRN